MSAETSESHVVGSCSWTGDTEIRTRPYPGIFHGLWHIPHPQPCPFSCDDDDDDDDVDGGHIIHDDLCISHMGHMD